MISLSTITALRIHQVRVISIQTLTLLSPFLLALREKNKKKKHKKKTSKVAKDPLTNRK